MITDAVSPALSASTKATHAANTQVRYRLPDYAIALSRVDRPNRSNKAPPIECV
jgi:hypothetical protein